MLQKVVLGLVVALPLTALPAAHAQKATTDAAMRAGVARVLQQVSLYEAESRQRTPAQQKIESNLLYSERTERGLQAVPGIGAVPLSFGMLHLDAHRRVLIDLKGDVDDGLLAALRLRGAEIVSAFPNYQAVRLWLPLRDVESLADLPAVRALRPAVEARFNRVAKLPQAIVNAFPTSEGDHAHGADLSRATYKVLGTSTPIDGTGINIGVLSSGVNSLSAQQTAGALPAVTVLPGQAGTGDEGTAMLEIVHTLAPGASLYFATGNVSEAGMATNIVNLQTVYHCNVIIDDVTYFDEGVFEDGPLSQAVNTVTAAGALYFSSAQNSGNETSMFSGTWEGDFRPGGDPAQVTEFGGTLHDWTGGGVLLNQITADTKFISLKWSDRLGASSQDYNLCLTDGSFTIQGCSTNPQTGSQDPFEGLQTTGTLNGLFVVVINAGGTALTRALHIDTERGQLHLNTPGATFGHNAAGSAVSVAAVPAANAGGSLFTVASGPIEYYSSDGFRRIFYTAPPTVNDITPGNYLFSTNGGLNLGKPDLTAADCVSTNVPGFSPFCGTSAAAPHAGAIAALGLQLVGGATATSAAQVRAAMLGDANLDIMSPGQDRDAGWGIVMAPQLMYSLSQSVPQLHFTPLTTPCRMVDTRNPIGPFGGPALQPNGKRQFQLSGGCGVPTGAKAVAVNVAAIAPSANGDLRFYPADAITVPAVSTINFVTGQTIANNATLALPLDGSGNITVQSDITGTVELVIDVSGYFE